MVRSKIVSIVLLCVPLMVSAGTAEKLGSLPAGVSPDSVDFTATEMYVLARGTISVYSLPDLVLRRTFCGPGGGAGLLSPRHQWDQTIRIAGDKVLAEDNNKIIFFSLDGRLLEEKPKPENTVWIVPFGKGYIAKNMIVTGDPALQVIRLVLYDPGLREVKEIYRQKWFQQLTPKGFETEFPGDLLHFAVAGDLVFVEKSPEGSTVGIFDTEGREIASAHPAGAPIPMTPADREGILARLRLEKRVATMIARTGSWEKLREIWSHVFTDFKPALREIQAYGDAVLVRTFEQEGDDAAFLLIDARGRVRKEIALPVGTDAETEARVCGTAFFKIIGGRVYFLKSGPVPDVWDVYTATAAGL